MIVGRKGSSTRFHILTRRSLVFLSSGEAGGTPWELGDMFSHFTPETVELLTAVQKAAMQEWEAAMPDATPMLKALAEVSVARALLEAAASGERDPERLKKVALTDTAVA